MHKSAAGSREGVAPIFQRKVTFYTRDECFAIHVLLTKHLSHVFGQEADSFISVWPKSEAASDSLREGSAVCPGSPPTYRGF